LNAQQLKLKGSVEKLIPTAHQQKSAGTPAIKPNDFSDKQSTTSVISRYRIGEMEVESLLLAMSNRR
jgi:hypothetical protein